MTIRVSSTEHWSMAGKMSRSGEKVNKLTRHTHSHSQRHRTDDRWGRGTREEETEKETQWGYCPNGLGYWLANEDRTIRAVVLPVVCPRVSSTPRAHLHGKADRQFDWHCSISVSANLFFLVQLATIAVSLLSFSACLIYLLDDGAIELSPLLSLVSLHFCCNILSSLDSQNAFVRQKSRQYGQRPREEMFVQQKQTMERRM